MFNQPGVRQLELGGWIGRVRRQLVLGHGRRILRYGRLDPVNSQPMRSQRHALGHLRQRGIEYLAQVVFLLLDKMQLSAPTTREPG